MSDLISRADAMEEFREYVKRANENGETPTWNDAVSLIGSLQSADAVDVNDVTIHYKPYPSADAVHGEWIHDGQNFKGGLDWCHCSECGYKTSTNGLSVYRYCPSCGARMKGGAEE